MKKTTKSSSKLIELHQSEILTRIAAGQSAATVARELGLSQRHIYRTLSASPGMEALQRSLDDAYRILEERLPSLVAKSLDVLQDDLERGFGDARRDAAKTVLATFSKLAAGRPCTCSNTVIDSTTTKPTEGNNHVSLQ